MKKHLLTVKTYNDALQLYKNNRTQWLDDDEANLLQDYFAANANIPGFYKYVLTFEGGKSIPHETVCADLVEYASHWKRKIIRNEFVGKVKKSLT